MVDGVNATPATYYVHADHLHRPIRMTNAAKSIVWSAEYQPWGAVQSLSGALTLDLRFPGQWFQLEAGLHYNWHRHYDPSLGRYTQADPLGFVDGPSVYGYARNNPYRYVDEKGRAAQVCTIPGVCPTIIKTVIEACTITWVLVKQLFDDDHDRCKKIYQQCKEDCIDIYVEDPDRLPGRGSDFTVRLHRCIRECTDAHGCGNWFN